MGKLANKKAIVTGAANGIGRAIALALAREGADVALLDLKKEAADAVASQITSLGVKGLAVKVDVGDEKSVVEAIAEVQKCFSVIDILVNNAGIDSTSRIVDMPTEMWDNIIRVNLRGVFLCTRAVLPSMLARQSGRIINVASHLAHKGSADMAHYSASKAGVVGFTRSLAYEVAREGIAVNAICPGPIDTELFRALPESWRKERMDQIPIGRVGTVDEIAPIAVMLACAEGAFFIGATLNSNGGDYMI